MRGEILLLCFRHRSSFLLLLSWPLAAWALAGRTVPWQVTAIGAAVAASGVLLRLVSVRRIGRHARVRRARARSGLIASGPYAWSRNPLYLAAGLMLTGLALVAGSGWAGLLMLPAAVAVYTPVVVQEERALRPLLGDAYGEYLRTVPRWIGVPRGAAPSTDSAIVPWREVLRREKLLVPGVLGALVAVAAIRTELLPLAPAVAWIGRPLGLGAPALAALGWAAAALYNSWRVERRLRRAKPAPDAASEATRGESRT